VELGASFSDEPDRRCRHEGQDWAIEPLLQCESTATQLGIKGITQTIAYDPTARDLSVEITRARASKADALLVVCRLDRLSPDDATGLAEVGSHVVAQADYQQGVVKGAVHDLKEVVTANDPAPGRWRVRVTSSLGGPVRLEIDFDPHTAEADPGQAPFDVSNMDFFDDLNKYIADAGEHFEGVTVDQVLADPSVLNEFDSVVVANDFMPGFVFPAEVVFTGEPQETIEFGFGPPKAAWYYGPFFRLLNTTPLKAIAFINRMLNHAALCRVADRPPRDPDPTRDDWSDHEGIALELTEATGRRHYIGDSHVWCWYRGTSVGPYACMSAVLALEAAMTMPAPEVTFEPFVMLGG
jgi:hypothetical protein